MLTTEFYKLSSDVKNISGLLHKLLEIPTLKNFFESSGIGPSDFSNNGVDSPKLKDFIKASNLKKNRVGSLEFIEFLLNDPYDNILKKTIKDKGAEFYGETGIVPRFYELKKSIFHTNTMPCVENMTLSVMSDPSFMESVGVEDVLLELHTMMYKEDINNVILTGGPGVGKTSIIKTFALRHRDFVTVYAVDTMQLFGKDRSTATAAFTNILNSLNALNKTMILFLDEFHIYAREGLADLLKPFLSSSKNVKVVAATTASEFRTYIEKDGALDRRFYPVPVKELEGETLKLALSRVLDKRCPENYMTYSEGLIDFVCDKMTFERHKSSPGKQKDVFDTMIALAKINNIGHLDEDLAAQVISKRTSIPKEQLLRSGTKALKYLENELKGSIKGQNYAIENVCRVIRSKQLGFMGDRPCSFIFAGETGVGKTELAKKLCVSLTGSESNLIRFDMSEFQERHTASTLLGAPPGYKGYDEGGKLVNAVREKPYAVLLLDEIEKAHPDIFDIFLQILDYGTVTDREGRIADFRNVIIIFTSNVGAHNTETMGVTRPIGFVKSQKGYDVKERMITEELYNLASYDNGLKKTFRAEFLNRISKIIVFSKLTRQSLLEITDIKLEERLQRAKLTVSYGKDVVEFLAEKARNPRELDRVMSDCIDSLICYAVLDCGVDIREKLSLVLEDNRIGLNRQ